MAKVMTVLTFLVMALVPSALAGAGLSLSPSSYDFGNVLVGQSVTTSFTLTNTNASGRIRNVDIDINSPFDIVSNNCGNRLDAGQSCAFLIRFEPNNSNLYSKTLRIDSDTNDIRATIRGEGKDGARFSMTPSSHDFNEIQIGQTAQRTFTLSNTGDMPATQVALTVSAPFSISTSNCGSSVAEGASCTFAVVFAPTAVGSVSRTLRAQAAECSDTSTVRGEGRLGPVVAFNPNGWDFGDVFVNQTSQKTIVVTNNGDEAAHSIAFSTGAPFSIVSHNCGTRLDPNEDCNVVVRFAPTQRAQAMGSLQFSSTEANASIALMGRGIIAAQVALLPNGYAFGGVQIGLNVVQEFTLSNSGDRSAQSLSISTSAPFQIVAGSCGASLAAGATCTFSARFTPVAAGAVSRSLSIAFTGGSLDVTLSGSGLLGPFLSLSPTSYDFGSVLVGNSTQTSFMVSNTGDMPAENLNFATLTPFQVISGSCGASLAAGASCSFGVQFTPSGAGSFAQNMSVTFDGGGRTATLSGSGLIGPIVSVSPEAYDFGTVIVGNSLQANFMISNTGDMSASGMTIASAAPFEVLSGTCGAGLGAGGNCAFSVRFTPPSAGNFSETVTVAFNGGSRSVLLSGVGEAVTVQNPGDLDPSFGVGGIATHRVASGNLTLTAIAQQTDGKIVMAGFYQESSRTMMALVRFTDVGALDMGFGDDGMVVFAFGATDDRLNGVTIQADGKILAVGQTNNGANADLALARLNSDGTLDSSFGSDNGFSILDMGWSTDVGMTVMFDSQGRILVGGYAFIEFEHDFLVARFSSEGILDQSFNGTGVKTLDFGFGDDRIFSMAMDAYDRLVLAGYARNSAGRRIMAVARLTAEGPADTTFNGTGMRTFAVTTGNSQARAIRVDGSDIVFAGFGMAGTQNRTYLAKLNEDGSSNTSFGVNGVTEFTTSGTGAAGRALGKDAQGRYIVSGTDLSAGSRLLVVRFLANGALDTSFGTNGVVSMSSGEGSQNNGFAVVGQASDGKIIAGGTNFDGTTLGFVAAKFQD